MPFFLEMHDKGTLAVAGDEARAVIGQALTGSQRGQEQDHMLGFKSTDDTKSDSLLVRT